MAIMIDSERYEILPRPIVSYEETLFHNARENLRAFRETLRQKDILFGCFYAAFATALVLVVCFSL